MRCARLARWLAPVVAGVLVTTVPAYAQRKAGSDEPLTVPRLEQPEKNRMQSLRDGKEALTDADKAILDKAARHYVFRLTDAKHQFPPPGAGSKQGMHDLVQEVFQYLPDPTKKPPSTPTGVQNQQQYVKEFTNRMAAHVLTLLDNANMIARVNGVILLARVAEVASDDLADPLCRIVEDKNQPDAIKFHALRGLRNLFANRKDEAFKGDAGEERLRKSLQTLSNFLSRKPTAEVVGNEEEREAFQYLRREAVRALAASRVPVLEKRRVALSRPSLELMRVAAGAGFEPPPSLTERVEAAVGLCTMQKTRDVTKYQPEVAAYFVGQVVVDFATQYDKDRGNQNALIDYKYYAYLLDDALKSFKQESGKVAFVSEMVDKAQPVLKGIEGNQQPNQLPLKDVLDRNNQADKELFKGDATTTLQAAPAAPAPPPAK